MHRIDHATRAVDLHGAGKDGFTEGNPVSSTPATVVTADMLNALQEEIATVIETSGITLNKASNAQLAAIVTPHIGWSQGPAVGGKRYAVIPAVRSNLLADAAASTTQWSMQHSFGGAGYVRSEANSGGFAIAIDGSDIPHGVTLTGLYMMCQQGATRIDGQRLRAWVSRFGFDWSTPAHGFTQLNSTVAIQAANNTSLQVANIAPSEFGSPYVFDRNQPLVVVVVAGSDAGTNKDRVYGFRVEWNDPFA